MRNGKKKNGKKKYHFFFIFDFCITLLANLPKFLSLLSDQTPLFNRVVWSYCLKTKNCLLLSFDVKESYEIEPKCNC